MTHLLAQVEPPVQPTERQLMAAEEAATRVAEKLLSGIDSAAESQPVQYLNVIVIVAVLIVIVVIAWKVFAYLREKEAREDMARAERAAEERAQREHQQMLADKFHAAQLNASSTCHEHSLKMLTERNEGSALLRESTADLKVVTGDLKAAVHDVRNVANENKLLIESVLLEKHGKPTTVNVQNNPLPKDSQ